MADKEIPSLFWNPKVHYCVHSNPPVVPILSQMNPVYTVPLYLFEIRYNTLLPSTPKLGNESVYYYQPLPRKYEVTEFVTVGRTRLTNMSVF
jgi:hypothetical protein